MPKISVIVPVYNASKYLNTCLDSLLMQNLKDLEIILIDDNSKDDSLKILEMYKDKYPDKIKLFTNLENKGPGFSRNIGLKHATGDYIGFVDSDDYIEKDMYNLMYQRAKINDDDIVITGLDLRYLNLDMSFFGRKVKLDTGIFHPMVKKDIIVNSRPSCCNKLFKGTLIGDHKFPESYKWEDYPFVILLMALSNKIEVLDRMQYHYRINLNGTTCGDMKNINSRLLDIFDVSDSLEDKFKKYCIEDIFKEELQTIQIANCLCRARDLVFKNIPYQEKRELINLILNLIEVKYGNWQDNPWYIKQKEDSLFYNLRMSFVEKCADGFDRDLKDEEEIKKKIKKFL